MEPLFSKQQCGFRKGYSTQYCLLSMLEKWKSAVDKGKYFGALLTDLSKAFDCISHELILAKLHAYGFSLRALRLIHSYLTNRKQRTRVNGNYSSWKEILFGVPQGSILRPLLFNIFLCDLFLIMKETSFASYADDNTPYVTAENLDEVIKSLEKDSIKLFQWFSDNQMKANYDKCHLLVSGKNNVTMNASGFKIKNSECEKLLGIKVDCGLKFENYLSGVIKKASNKINALSRVTPFMNLSKKKMLMNSFFKSQFSYCPLVWMCHSPTINNTINHLHERCLRVIYNKISSFKELLERDWSVPIHNRNLQILATEMFKVYNDVAPPIFTEIFNKRNPTYQLRHTSHFSIPPVTSVYNGTESLSFLGPMIWGIVPTELKKVKSLSGFKSGIKNWWPQNCPCRLCKRYLPKIGFV